MLNKVPEVTIFFWIAYVLTRPLGASLGDLLAQSQRRGGLGLGTTVTSVVCLGLILIIIIYLTLTRRDAALSRRDPDVTVDQ